MHRKNTSKDCDRRDDTNTNNHDDDDDDDDDDNNNNKVLQSIRIYTSSSYQMVCDIWKCVSSE